MHDLDLDLVPEVLQAKARHYFETGDVLGMLITMDNMNVPFFVSRNILPLKQAGILESAILQAWSGVRVNSRHTGGLFDFLFSLADRGKLLACGDPAPGPGPYTLYRGVAGTGRARRVRGFSWTNSFDLAQGFARRFDLPDPAVYRIEAPDSWILAYLNQSHRNENEFIVMVPREAKIARMK